jgi:hypothetical protein
MLRRDGTDRCDEGVLHHEPILGTTRKQRFVHQLQHDILRPIARRKVGRESLPECWETVTPGTRCFQACAVLVVEVHDHQKVSRAEAMQGAVERWQEGMPEATLPVIDQLWVNRQSNGREPRLPETAKFWRRPGALEVRESVVRGVPEPSCETRGAVEGDGRDESVTDARSRGKHNKQAGSGEHASSTVIGHCSAGRPGGWKGFIRDLRVDYCRRMNCLVAVDPRSGILYAGTTREVMARWSRDAGTPLTAYTLPTLEAGNTALRLATLQRAGIVWPRPPRPTRWYEWTDSEGNTWRSTEASLATTLFRSRGGIKTPTPMERRGIISQEASGD